MTPIVIFDPQTSGHHREFLSYLGEGMEPNFAERLTFWVHPDFALPGVLPTPKGRVALQALPSDLAGSGQTLPSAKQARAQLTFLVREAPQGAHIFFPRLNAYSNALLEVPLFGQHFTCSGIIFSPASGVWLHKGGCVLEYLRSIHEIRRLRRLRKKAGLERLYVLSDPRTASVLAFSLQLRGGVHPLADPIAPIPGVAADEPLPTSPPGSGEKVVTFLLLGAQRPNKGSLDALRAFQSWRPTPDVRTRLILAGDVCPDFASSLEAAVDAFRAAQPTSELLTDFSFLDKDGFEHYLKAADFILLPYRRALGSSGLLGHAVRCSKPVLATNEGLIGSLVSEEGLGETFPVRSVPGWHSVLDAAVAGNVKMDPIGQARYLKRNSIKAFQKTLLEAFKAPSTSSK